MTTTNEFRIAEQAFHKALDLSLVDEHPLNPRIHDEDAIAGSIKLRGFYGAVIVWANPETPGRFYILAGHGRIRKARAAGATTIPAFEQLGINADEALALLLDDNGVSDLATLDRQAYAKAAAALAPGTAVITVDPSLLTGLDDVAADEEPDLDSALNVGDEADVATQFGLFVRLPDSNSHEALFMELQERGFAVRVVSL